MSSDNVPLLNLSRGPSAVQFGANKDFQTRTQQQELDGAFLGNERRPWLHAQPKQNLRREHETIASLLSATTSHRSAAQAKELLEESINFRDLSSLTDEDLQLFGFASSKERNELIEMFADMPNQDPSYEYICNTNEAQGYNNQIVSHAASHLSYLRSSLAATNYKLRMMPPEDVIVGDKSYASRFALDALNSVQSISDELAKDLRKLEQLTMEHRQKIQNENAAPTKEKNLKILYYTAIALGTACAWFWWWSKCSHSPNLDMSLKI
ncbi:uncharacterized protein LOC117564730 [Drosophila albomicans]|uniref:Uncharacterized protein LOC117564730 n=1 Tax=Drosophila albomicans TaxID=7291 RepID=A0A6P8WJN6_DROAB|nr:uncharacterized protein LOC117564730 [Drosophila albomicans]